MADILPTRYVVKPTGWETSPYSDTYHFYVEVVRRNLADPTDPEEWAVCPYGFTSEGFTLKGKRVSLRGSNRVNRRHAVFDLKTALELAEAIVEGTVEAKQFRPLRSLAQQASR